MMKKYWKKIVTGIVVGIMLNVLLIFAVGCQTVQTEDGKKQYQVDSRVTDAVHATIHTLDIPVKAVCDVAGQVVGAESKEPVVKTEKQLRNEEFLRVGGAIILALLTL
jgi:hypothetical protein